MMVRTKRGIGDTSFTNESSAKRSKRTSLESTGTNGSEAQSTLSSSQGSPSQTFWKIKDIIGESSTKYQIDWEDEPVTGQRYSPTWEPKACANEAAVLAWREIKRAQYSAAPARNRSRPIVLSSSLEDPSPVVAQTIANSDRHSELEPLPDSSEAFVQVSQRSIPDRDQYQTFQPSQSQSSLILSSPQERRPQSSLVQNLSTPQGKIVPDSQASEPLSSPIQSIQSIRSFQEQVSNQAAHIGIGSDLTCAASPIVSALSVNGNHAELSQSFARWVAPRGEINEADSVPLSAHKIETLDSIARLHTIPSTISEIPPIVVVSDMSEVLQSSNAAMIGSPLARSVEVPRNHHIEQLRSIPAMSQSPPPPRDVYGSSSSQQPVVGSTGTTKDAEGAVGDSRLTQDGQLAPAPPTVQPLHQELQRAGKLSHNAEKVPATTELYIQGLQDYEIIVPLELSASSRSQFYEILRQHKDEMQKIMDLPELSEKTVERIERLFDDLDSASIHLDLFSWAPATQADGMDAEDALKAETEFTETSSTKFQFLGNFLDYMRESERHIVVVGGQGNILDILERFMQGKRIPYAMAGKSEMPGPVIEEGKVFVTILNSEEESAIQLTEPVDAIIAIDESIDMTGERVTQIRTQAIASGRRCPIIHPIVYCSTEHIVCCLPPNLNSTERIRALITTLQQTKRDIGLLSDGEMQAKTASEEAAIWVLQGAIRRNWIFPDIRPIRVEGLDFASSGYSTEGSVSNWVKPAKKDAGKYEGTMPGTGSRKRMLDDLKESDSAKRRRLRTQLTDADADVSNNMESNAPSNPDITHISDSVKNSSTSSQSASQVSAILDAAKHEIRKMKKETRARVAQLEAELALKDTTLKEHADALQQFWDVYSHEKAELRRTQRQLVALQAERIAEQDSATTLQQRLETELAAARSPAVPPSADKLDAAEASRRLAAAASDASFFRTRYQETDAFATALRAENAELAEAARRATARLAFVQLDARNAAAERARAADALALRDREVAELTAQLDSVMRARGRGVATRSGSQRPGGGGGGAGGGKSPYASPARGRVESPRRVAVGLGVGGGRRGRTLE